MKKWLSTVAHIMASTVLLRSLIPLLSLGLIGYGFWTWHKPLAFIVVGGLIWLDISLPKKKRAPDGRG